jgi:enamine deaminase RidA (YjgF/YER057c/UK114 family)
LVTLLAGPDGAEQSACSRVDLGDLTRLALTLIPAGRGAFHEQALEIMAGLKAILAAEPAPMTVTVQTVFLRHAADQPECEALFREHYGLQLPVTNFVIQPPCSGAALALEAWAVAGDSVRIERFGPHALAVACEGARWVYCGGIKPLATLEGAYAQTLDALARMNDALRLAGCSFQQTLRTWFYLEGITRPEAATSRYQELNRARSDFYRDIPFCSPLFRPQRPQAPYPASTGIGMSAASLLVGCVALQTRRQDVLLLSLENPQQTPAYAYDPKYSSQSPKFSRAMALLLGDYMTTWISGTASIVSSDSRHPGDIEKQTQQTIDNIQRLISRDNFAAHGVSGAGAGFEDLAKIRVYLKRPEDLAKCRAICARRFGTVPAIYAVADVCRPELLVEIEGVAFSRCSPPAPALESGKY